MWRAAGSFITFGLITIVMTAYVFGVQQTSVKGEMRDEE